MLLCVDESDWGGGCNSVQWGNTTHIATAQNYNKKSESDLFQDVCT
jgi:hypothetical protein